MASQTFDIDISIHALLAESDNIPLPNAHVISEFLSTLSLRRATNRIDCYPQPTSISIHALLAESDLRCLLVSVFTNISIHALLAESDWWLRCWKLAARDISIHALLAESDSRRALGFVDPDISIHALLAESDIDKISNQCKIDKFLSTLSLRRATLNICYIIHPR